LSATAVGNPRRERFPFGQSSQLSFNLITLVLAKNFFLWEVFERAEREHGRTFCPQLLVGASFRMARSDRGTHKDSGGCLPPLIGIKAIGCRLSNSG